MGRENFTEAQFSEHLDAVYFTPQVIGTEAGRSVARTITTVFATVQPYYYDKATTSTGAAATNTAADFFLWNSAEYLSLEDAEALPHQQQQRVLYLCDYCKMMAIVLYSLLSVVAFLGNSLILAVFFFIRRLRTPTNMLIANLAVADFMISIFCIPLSYWHVVIFEDQRWIFGAFLCKIFNYLQATAVFLSSWTLVAISFDRFMAIWFAMSPWLRINRRKAFYIILATWIFSLTMALPLLIVNKVEISRTAGGGLVETCQEHWELLRGMFMFGDDEARLVHAYTWLVFALQYCLPLLVLLLTYTFIGLRMWNSKVPGEPTISNLQSSTCSGGGGGSTVIPQKSVNAQDRRQESVKKLIPMVLLVSALYAGCWLPQNLLMNIWVSYDSSITSHPYILYIWWGSHTLAMFHSIVNPFIYYYQNKRIHEALNYLLGYLPCVRSKQQQHTPLIANHFYDDTINNNNTVTTTTTATTTMGAGGLNSRKMSVKSGAEGVRIVNMVAYMPAAGGKRAQLNNNSSNSSSECRRNSRHTIAADANSARAGEVAAFKDNKKSIRTS